MQFLENKACYATAELRQRLIEVAPLLSGFFLTGGTALSVFYLHHRHSEDLDWFTYGTADLNSIIREIQLLWPQARLVKNDGFFASLAIGAIKLDLVIEHNDDVHKSARISTDIEGAKVTIDSFRNILANKLTTLLSRGEPKDFIDFHAGWNTGEFTFDELFGDARLKEGRFDDPADAAYHIEQNIQLARSRKDWPVLLRNSGPGHWFETAHLWADWLYERGRRDAGLP